MNKFQKLEKKNLRRWRSSRAGERITRAAAQGGVELLRELREVWRRHLEQHTGPSEPRCGDILEAD